MRGHYFFADGVESDLPSGHRRDAEALRRQRERTEALAARHQPIERFAPGLRVEITAPSAQHRPLAGRTGAVILVNESGSAWVRVELPQGRVADHCLTASECSREVARG
jgi:hypothetical protein